MSTASSNRPPLDVLVIVGGQAGLAMGYQLTKDGRRFEILDAAPEIGHGWRSRWDSLKLFTSGRYDNLPGLPFPADPDAYPSKDTRRHGIRLRPGVTRAAGRAVTFADGSAFEYDAVLLATGFTHDNTWIDIPGVIDEGGRIRQPRGITPSPGLYTLGSPGNTPAARS
jgi:cation diffusion facilitator CzcD-associated flavoprotein CzcO